MCPSCWAQNQSKEGLGTAVNSSLTPQWGYTARLRVDLSSAAEDSKFVSCYICVTAGEYDIHLEWPFRGTFTVSILNHSESGKDYSRQLSSENGTQPSKNNEIIFGERNFITVFGTFGTRPAISLLDRKHSLLQSDCRQCSVKDQPRDVMYYIVNVFLRTAL